ncbi:hypothetical protein GCM10010191_46610 [Actinomadura vinacea]|uniref:IPT/TIG domain-containing protein n=2 Tax=Actinomadura vinacea TaxID=115336 RepID=A0ABP5WJ34_9ACTN
MAPPVVSNLNPTQGPVTGGNTVVITGIRFYGTTKVRFGGAAAAFTVNSNTQITATAPPAAGPSTVNVTVAGPHGTSQQTVPYTYSGAVAGRPAVVEVAPGEGPVQGGNTVTITGTNLAQAGSVLFGTAAAVSFTIIADDQLVATVPAGSGSVQVTVVSPGGTSRTTPCTLYTYLAVPVVASLTPDEGPSSGGASVVITGSSLTQATDVFFGAVPAPFSVVSDEQLVARTPAGSGTVTVTVANAAGTSSPGVPYSYQ